MISAASAGFLLGLGLIVAIGAQNAFVLRQGLRNEHVLAVCLTCALSDAVLITIGVAGFEAMSNLAPWIEPGLRYGGVAFLMAYGLRSFWSAFRTGGALAPAGGGSGPLPATLATCAAITWLNPHVYLDTIVLLGSVSTQYQGQESYFAAGAVTASFSFFFALGHGARLLRPVFARPLAWRMLDLAVGIVMWSIAASLLIGS